MRKNGAMFICNRCRKQVFAERFDDGSMTANRWTDGHLIAKESVALAICARTASKRTGRQWMDSGMVENMGPEKICCNCRWHEEYTWVCFNGLSLNCTDVTDVEDSCEHWEKRH